MLVKVTVLCNSFLIYKFPYNTVSKRSSWSDICNCLNKMQSDCIIQAKKQTIGIAKKYFSLTSIMRSISPNANVITEKVKKYGCNSLLNQEIREADNEAGGVLPDSWTNTFIST